MIDINLRTKLLSDAMVTSYLDDPTAPGAIQQNKIDENGPETRIFFVRTGSFKNRCLDGTVMNIETAFDVECHSPHIDTAMNLADAVKSALDDLVNGATLGSLNVYVDDHDDSYIVKGDYRDAGTHVAAL